MDVIRSIASRFWALKCRWKGPIIAVVIITAIGITGAGGDTDDDADAVAETPARTPAATIAATEAAPEVTASPAATAPAPDEPVGFGDGSYVVGGDIEPGRYQADGGSFCYWERLAGFSGSLDDILANHLSNGQVVVDILPSDAGFSAEGCGSFVRAPTVGDPGSGPIGDGTYIVGVEIAPGTWRAEGGDACYWERLSGFDGEITSVLANNLGGGSAIVEIAASDAGFHTSGCGRWERV